MKLTGTEHVATAPVPDNVHVPEGVNVTVPVGVVAPVVPVSVMVAVQVVGWPIATVLGLQETIVVVVRVVTVTLAAALGPLAA